MGISERCGIFEYTVRLLEDKPQIVGQVVGVCCGYYSSYVLLNDGSLLGFGTGICFGTSPKQSFFHPKLLMKDTSIRRIACGQEFVLLEKMNGEVVLSCTHAHSPGGNFTKVILKGEKVDVLLQGMSWRCREWSPEAHKYYPHSFRKGVLSFLFCLRELQMKVPKYVLFHIIKKIK